MGNFQELMAKAKPLDQYGVQNVQDKRSQNQIMLSDHLVPALSALNLQRILKSQELNRVQELDWSSYAFIFIHGIPSIQNQFDFLDVPGKNQYHFSCISFQEIQPSLPQSEQQSRAHKSTFQKEAERLKQLIESVPKDKKIIFIYHSFGNFILSFYFFYYGTNLFERIKGMIDIAGGPMTHYMSSKMFGPVILQTSYEEILQNIDKVHKIFIKSIKSTGFAIDFKNKYQTLSFMRYIQSKDFGKGFVNTTNHPNILKLFIHGNKDTLFETTLLNQKVIYYCYKKQFQQDYNNKITNKFSDIHKTNKRIKNIQQKYILQLHGGHSIHYRQQNKRVIKLAAHEYLNMIYE